MTTRVAEGFTTTIYIESVTDGRAGPLTPLYTEVFGAGADIISYSMVHCLHEFSSRGYFFEM